MVFLLVKFIKGKFNGSFFFFVLVFKCFCILLGVVLFNSCFFLDLLFFVVNYNNVFGWCFF